MILHPVKKNLFFFKEKISIKISKEGIIDDNIDINFIQLLHKEWLIEKYNQSVDYKNLSFWGEKEVIAPLNVTIQLTNMCNLLCSHCHRVDKWKQHLDLTKLKEIINDLYKMKVFNVNFSWWEPLLYPDIFEAIEYANAKGLKTTMSSNLILRNENIAKRISQLWLKQIHVSLDSSNPDQHDKIRGVKWAYSGMIKNLWFLKQEWINFTFVTTLINQSFWDYKDIIDLSYSLWASGHKTNLLVPQWQWKWLYVEYYKNRDVLKQYIDIFKERKNYYKGKFDVIWESMLLSTIWADILNAPEILQNLCPAGELTWAITEKWEVLACPFYSEVSMGNINEDSFKNIWESSLLRKKITLNKQAHPNQCQARWFWFSNKINNLDTQSEIYLEWANSKLFYQNSANKRLEFVEKIWHWISIQWKKGNKEFYDCIHKYILSSENVLELGCWTGVVLKTIWYLAKKYIATDFSEEMLNIAKRNLVNAKNIKFKQEDVNNMWFLEETFDLIIKRLAPDNLNEIYRVLKYDGHFINFTNWEFDWVELKNLFSLPQHKGVKEYKKELENAQFSLIDSQEFTFIETYPDFATLSSMLKIAPIIPNYEENNKFYDEILQNLFVDWKQFSLTRHKLLTDVRK